MEEGEVVSVYRMYIHEIVIGLYCFVIVAKTNDRRSMHRVHRCFWFLDVKFSGGDW